MKKTITSSESITRQIEAYGFINFIESAKTQLKLMTPGTSDHAILEFLLSNAVGVGNAKTWKKINGHLEDLGLKIPKNRFQNGLLQRSRKNLFYIGSCNKGFYIFEKQSDVETALNFYDTRIKQEMANRDALRFLQSKSVLAIKDARELALV